MEAVGLVFVGWTFGILTCLLYVSVKGYVQAKRRNRRAKGLPNSGMGAVDVIRESDL